MITSLRALLTGVIDYAGMYPPASLSLEEAVAKYRQYRAGDNAWMLGRFVCPAERLPELADIYQPAEDGPLTVVFTAHEMPGDCLRRTQEFLPSCARFPFGAAIEAIEFSWKGGELDATWLATYITSLNLNPQALFFELASPSNLENAIAAVSNGNRPNMRRPFQAGSKIRTGGATAANVPSAEQLAEFIIACRDAGVFWKATGGLHHPLRNYNATLKVVQHGFLNVLIAAVMADTLRLDAEQVRSILKVEAAESFEFTDGEICWSGFAVTAEQITAARQRSLRSFGSCSFDEPRDDLRALALL